MKRWRVGDRVVCVRAPEGAISHTAIRSPRIVTMRAASLSIGGIDITGVLRGVTLKVIHRPARILPHASRLRGLITWGFTSSMGEIARDRGWAMTTKYIRRVL